jgi:hypothetical protein
LAGPSIVGLFVFVIFGLGEIRGGMSANRVSATSGWSRGRGEVGFTDENATRARLGPPDERGEHLVVGGSVYKVQPGACKKRRGQDAIRSVGEEARHFAGIAVGGWKEEIQNGRLDEAIIGANLVGEGAFTSTSGCV